MDTPESNETYMRRALDLAGRGLGTTRPNPLVGAVIVRNGEVVGEGFHAYAGGPHAEVVAIDRAGDAARGATMYVTLEPCNHHGRTPPCTEAILEAGIERVYYASRDTNPGVRGGGADFLKANGLDCIQGPLVDEAFLLNRGYFHWHRTGRPWVVSKFAASLDGKIATRTGESRWITGPEARRRGHELRRQVDGVLVGVGTVVSDNPLLTVRLDGEPSPTSQPAAPTTRIVLDSRGRSPVDSRIFVPDPGADTIVATTDASPAQWRQELMERGVDVLARPRDQDGRIDVKALLHELGRREIRSLLVEGGPTVHGSFFDAGLVNEVWAFLAPVIIGGRDAPGAVAGTGISSLEDALRLQSVEIERCGPDVLLRGLVLDPRLGGDDTKWEDRPDRKDAHAEAALTRIINH